MGWRLRCAFNFHGQTMACSWEQHEETENHFTRMLFQFSLASSVTWLKKVCGLSFRNYVWTFGPQTVLPSHPSWTLLSFHVTPFHPCPSPWEFLFTTFAYLRAGMHIAGQFHVTHYNIGETRVNRKYCTYVSLLWPEFCILYVHLLCDKENQSLV